jgi:zinc protease
MKRTIIALLCSLVLLLSLPAEETGYQGLSRYKLPNGTELFVYKDSAVPIARVEVCFRAGAAAQDQDSAGLFHLYEHLALGDGAATKAALAGIGASEWNGGTEIDRVDYWLTIPSDKVEGGLRFWAERLRPAAFGEAELAAAKDVVAAELKARGADPETIFEAALDRRLFPKYTWRVDPAGSEKSVRAASPSALEKLRDTWFVPNNMAIIVAGDVDPEAARAFAESAFAGWKAAADPWAKAPPAHARPGVTRPTWMVESDPSLPEGIARVELRYRGPDLGADPQSGYAAELWTALLSDPQGRFAAAVRKNVPQLYGSSPLSAFFLGRRDSSVFGVSAYMSIAQGLSTVDRVRDFKENVRGYEITSMRSNPNYFSADSYAAAKARLEAERRIALESPEGLSSALAEDWASASAEHFLKRPAALAKLGADDIVAFVDGYVLRNLEVISIRMSPADYDREKKSFSGSGFDLANADNSFWWQRQ